MKFIVFLAILLSFNALSSEFPMGDASKKWGIVVGEDAPQFDLRLGTRLQAISDLRQTEQNNNTSSNVDFYMRRVRFMVEIDYKEDWTFYMDVRNDDSNKQDKGEGDFNVGDAYLLKRKLTGTDLFNLKLLRAKVDVSRTETISSARLLYLNRAQIADHAAQYVSHNRRATNIQLDGNWKRKIHYQVVVGDGVASDKFFDTQDNKPTAIVKQNAMVGARIRLSPFEGWEEGKLTETYYGKGQHFSFGAGVFNTSNIKVQTSSGTYETDRTLFSAEISFHQGPWNLSAEWFHFQGEFKDYSVDGTKGKSKGHFIQGEYYISDLAMAPFFRVEHWDRFEENDGYTLQTYILGWNYYLKGEKFRTGIFVGRENYGQNIGDEKVTFAQLALMMNY